MSDEERGSSGDSDASSSSDGILVDPSGYNDEYAPPTEVLTYNLAILDPDLFILPALQVLFMLAVAFNEHEIATCHAVQRLSYFVHPIAVTFCILLVSRLGLRIVYIEMSGSRFRFHAIRELRGQRFITVKSHLRVYEALLVAVFVVGFAMLLVLWFTVPSMRATGAVLPSGLRCEDSVAHGTCIMSTLIILGLCITEAVFIGQRRRREQSEIEEKARRAMHIYEARNMTTSEAQGEYDALVVARSSRVERSVVHKRRALAPIREDKEEREEAHSGGVLPAALNRGEEVGNAAAVADTSSKIE